MTLALYHFAFLALSYCSGLLLMGFGFKLTDQFEKAVACLNDILREDLADVPWNEIALIYYFYGMLFHPSIINNNLLPNAMTSPASLDVRFMIRSQLKLALLFLDTEEMESADETVAFITQTIQTPLHLALILAVRRSIAAARDKVTAARYFAEALDDLENQDETLFIPSIEQALARVSRSQG